MLRLIFVPEESFYPVFLPLITIRGHSNWTASPSVGGIIGVGGISVFEKTFATMGTPIPLIALIPPNTTFHICPLLGSFSPVFPLITIRGHSNWTASPSVSGIIGVGGISVLEQNFFVNGNADFAGTTDTAQKTLAVGRQPSSPFVIPHPSSLIIHHSSLLLRWAKRHFR